MFEPLALPAINRLLRTNAWALDKLSPHMGKSALISCAPFTLRATVTETGALAAAPHATPDVTITLTPGVILRTAARDEEAWLNAQVTGDVEFAGAIGYVWRNIAWDYEEDLSRVFGDVAAHRMATAARQLDSWGRNTLLNLGQAAAEYATFERPALASAHAVSEFNREVDTLRDDAARLEKRIALLARRLAG